MENNNNLYKSKLSILGVNVVYLLTAILFLTVGAFVQSKSFNIGIIITEFVLVALPAILYVIIKRGSIRQELRFKGLPLVDAILVLLIFLCGYPVALFINIIGNIFISFFGKLIASPIPIAGNVNEYFLMLLIVAGSAGLCEEILFRGLLLRGYEKLGMWKSIIFTAVLFAMLHMNIQNILGPLFLGILLGYVVYMTDSLYAGMLGHFANNAISVSITFLLMQLPLFKNVPTQELPAGAETLGLFVWAVILGFAAILPAIILFFCMRALKGLRDERKRVEEVQEVDENEFESQKLRKLLGRPRISWPLYVSFALFCAYSILQFAYVMTGKSLFEAFF